MEKCVNLKEDIKNPTVICGYKSSGMVGALVANQLLDEMDFKEVGSCQLRKIPPVLAIRKDRMLKPMSMFYNKENNLLLIFILAPSVGVSWEVSDIIEEISKQTQAKEIIVPEGILIKEQEKDTFYLSNHEVDEKIKNKYSRLERSVLMGITSALMIKKELPVLCLFGNMGKATKAKVKLAKWVPSNKSAAHVIDALNYYLDLDLDKDSLIERGNKVEKQLTKFIDRMKEIQKKSGKSEELRYIR